MKWKFTSLHWLFATVLGLGVAGCASIGRPQGGEKDQLPPEFVTSNPMPGATNVDRNKIDIIFNENIQLEDAFNKVVVSPVQKTNPAVSSNAKKVTVELKDSLLPNTTYTIDFADAIKDLNEGNILDGFTTFFSTGDSIDTLRISGIVLEAQSLEPAQSMLVGVYSQPTDTSIYTLPLERIARTNQLGQFTIYNLKPGNYSIFALNDVNRDYKWDRTEDVAFYDLTVSPWAESIEVVDTLRSKQNTDSLVSRAGTAFFPNDILLTWFNEGYQSQYLKDYKREDLKRFSLQMAAPADSLPVITIAKGPYEGLNATDFTLLQANPTRDSLMYWICDTTIMKLDSLYLSVRYQRTDTNELLTWKSDTLKFFFKEVVDKNKDKNKKKDEEKKRKKEIDKQIKENLDTLALTRLGLDSLKIDSMGLDRKQLEEMVREVLEKDTVKTVPEIPYLNFKSVTGTNQELNMPLIFESEFPIKSFEPNSFRLEIMDDTLWYPIDGVTMEIDSLSPLQRRIFNVPEWEEGEKYRFSIDSAAVVSIYDIYNKPIKHEFNTKKNDEYSALAFNIIGLDSLPAFVELLDKSEKVLRKAPVVNGKSEMRYLKPGAIYARLIIDTNDNGVWDTGNLKDSIQPEEVYYYPKKINLKQNWDITQDWNIYEVAIDMQKPNDIKKNKPKLKKGEKQPVNDEDEEEDEDNGFGNFGNRNNNNNTNYGRNNNYNNY